MKITKGKLVGNVVRWLIATVGIVWVISNLHIKDRVVALTPDDTPVERILAKPAGESADTFDVVTEKGVETLPRDRVINGPDRKTVTLPDGHVVPLLGMRLDGDINKHPHVHDLLIKDSSGKPTFIKPDDVAGGFNLDVPQPRVKQGLGTMLGNANPWLIIAAFATAVIPFVFTTIRWHKLLAALDVHLTMSRTLVLNMVGAFYNTFMPGSTGGDVLKAYYAAKQAPGKKTAAVMSVIIDRILGLIALIILGGTMAGVQWFSSPDKHEAVARQCGHVALFAVAIIICCIIGSLVLFTPYVKKWIGLHRLMGHHPIYAKLQNIMRIMHDYRRRPGLVVWAILITMPVHAAVVVSAMFAGKAFGLPISAEYYFIVVPVVVLAGSIPISPQGVGVMEAFAFYLTRPQGVTLNQALALTMSIRLVGIFWNLVGGFFVLKGGFHAPTEAERHEVEEVEEAEAAV